MVTENVVPVPDRMHAAFIDRLGPADSIRYGVLPVPVPEAEQVLVRVEAVSVNPVDTFVRSGAYDTPLPFPFVIGRDLAGQVAALGESVRDFAVGDRVWTDSLGHAGRQGAAAEYAVVETERLYPLLDGVDPVEMAATAHAAATAYLALHVHGDLRAGETALVAGAAGNVGRAAIQVAVDAGARVIATASAADLDSCLALGAVEAFDYRDPELARRLRHAAPAGVHVHLDTSGHHDLDLAIGLLASRGRLILMPGLGRRPELPVGALYTRDAQIRGFAISTAFVEELAEGAALINRLVSDGRLAPPAIEELPLSAAADAHARMESGDVHGVKLVLRP